MTRRLVKRDPDATAARGSLLADHGEALVFDSTPGVMTEQQTHEHSTTASTLRRTSAGERHPVSKVGLGAPSGTGSGQEGKEREKRDKGLKKKGEGPPSARDGGVEIIEL